MPPFPYYPNARTNGAHVDLPDWVTSGYPEFEKAVNSGASAHLQQVAQNQRGEVNRGTVAGKVLPQLDQWNRWVVEQHLASPDQVDEFNSKAIKYFLPRVLDWPTLGSVGGNKPGTITSAQDALARKLFNAHRDDPQMVEQFKNYNDAINSRRLQIVR